MRCIREYAREIAVIRSLFSAQNEEIGLSLSRRAARGPAGGAESDPQNPYWIKFSRGDAYCLPTELPLKDNCEIKNKCNARIYFDDINTCIIVLHNNLYLYVTHGNIFIY